MEKSIQQWIDQGKKNGRQYFFYQNNVVDLTEFIYDHPGGVKAIKNYLNKDITNILFQVYRHNKQPTLNVLFKYKIGTIPKTEGTQQKQKNQKSSQGEKGKKKVCFSPNNTISKIQKTQIQTKKQDKKSSQKKNNLKQSQKKNNLKQSTNKSKASNKQASKSKQKKDEYMTSIKVLDIDQQQKILSAYTTGSKKTYTTGSKKKSNQKKANGNKQNSCSFINNQLDQQKPVFKVPILTAKLMQKNF